MGGPGAEAAGDVFDSGGGEEAGEGLRPLPGVVAPLADDDDWKVSSPPLSPCDRAWKGEGPSWTPPASRLSSARRRAAASAFSNSRSGMSGTRTQGMSLGGGGGGGGVGVAH